MTRQPTLARPSWRQRLALAAAAAGTTGTLTLTVFGAFHQASSTPWLMPSPEVLDAAAGCRALHDRAAREACHRNLLARRTQPVGPTRLADGSQGLEATSR